MKIKILNSVLVIFILALFSGCTKNNETAKLVVSLTDSPGDYDAVNVDIQSVQVNSNASASESDPGWTTLNTGNIGVVNLLDYTNGTEKTLSSGDFPSGRISQIRLVLGTNNSVTMGENTMDLVTPSAQQSGLKLLVNTNLNAGVTYKFTLDFDAAKSVVKTGSNKYILKPVIKVITEAESGAISGTVDPASENVAVYVISGTGSDADTVASSYAVADDNNYLISGVPEGTYRLSFDPGESSTYDTFNRDDVNVTLGEVTKEDPVTLVLK